MALVTFDPKFDETSSRLTFHLCAIAINKWRESSLEIFANMADGGGGTSTSDGAAGKDKIMSSSSSSELKTADSKDSISVKVICLGDSAVGKSK